ncbi:unnamed protein product, partial [Brassica oleracea]
LGLIILDDALFILLYNVSLGCCFFSYFSFQWIVFIGNSRPGFQHMEELVPLLLFTRLRFLSP